MTDRKRTSQDKQAAKARIFIVDDHPIVRQGVAQLLNREPDMVVCGEADNAADALRALEAAGADLAIVDLSLKDSSGMDLIKDLQLRMPKLPLLVLSMRDESVYAERALRAGAKGYVTKEEGAERVLEGIRRVLRGEVYLSDRLAAKMITKMVGARPGRSGLPGEVLSDRELEVFEMLGMGMATREIARKLHLSVKTVESHREHIKSKLKISSAHELLKQAIQWVQTQGAI